MGYGKPDIFQQYMDARQSKTSVEDPKIAFSGGPFEPVEGTCAVDYKRFFAALEKVQDELVTPSGQIRNSSRLFLPGRRVNKTMILGRVLPSAKGSYSGSRTYLLLCDCDKIFRAEYDEIYYRNVFSCGCMKRQKHPPIKMEGERIGRLEVMRWDEEEGAWECVCHECAEIIYRKTVKEMRVQAEDCTWHKPRAN